MSQEEELVCAFPQKPKPVVEKIEHHHNVLVKPDAAVDAKTGEFRRAPSTFRNTIEHGTKYPPQGNQRYHLYVSYACPWASRCLAFRSLKGLTDVIPVHVVNPVWGDIHKPGEDPKRGWIFTDEEFAGIKCNDPLYNLKSLRELYELAEPNFLGKYTVPVLWDTETKQIVNNESSEIIKMLNDKFNDFAKNPELDLFPKEKISEIDRLSDWMYDSINNGVYRAGFARHQESYSVAYHVVFKALDEAEQMLDKSRFLTGDTLNSADIRLFVTLIRFDSVYYTHFKCNKKRIEDYPNIREWLRDVYQSPGIKVTVNMDHIKNHYFGSHEWINPLGIVPIGPDIDYNSAHSRHTRKYIQ